MSALASSKVKVLIVDDSAVIRAIITRTLEQQPFIEIVGAARDGEEAIGLTAAKQPHIILLDIEMPVMDGMAALPLILKEKPDVLVLMCSTLSARGADISMRALAMGAADCILKPGGESITTAQSFQAELVRVINQLAQNLNRDVVTAPVPMPARVTSSNLPPRVLAICSSTGGPKALVDVLKDLRGLSVPIVITQHMPRSFTTLLAQNIQQSCGITSIEGADGMVLKPGHVYVAPGGSHMLVKSAPEGSVVQLDNGPPENYCKPSADPMLRSLVQVYGGRILIAVLTGMGSDGLEGSRLAVAQGARVIAQDEATSVVWGMPGAVARAGLCSAVLPLPQIAGALRQSIAGTASKMGVA